MTSKPSILREKLKEATTLEILAAAEAELADKGLAATSMAAIAQRAGVAVGTLYNYFKDKEVLLTTLISDRQERFRSHIEAIFAPQAELAFEAHLASVITAVFELFENERNYLRIVLSNEKPTLRADAHGKEPTPGRRFIDRFHPLLAKGVASGVLAPDDQDLYAATLAAILRGVMIERVEDASRPFGEAVPFVMRVFLEGARKRP